MSTNIRLPQMSDEARASASRYIENQQKAIQYIAEGRTKEETLAMGEVPSYILDVAYSTVRPWALPSLPQPSDTPPEIPALTERQQQVWDLKNQNLTQKRIAEALGCSQSTVAYTMKQLDLIRDRYNQVKVRAGQVVYQTRIHLFVHGMELWNKVKELCLGEQLLNDINEAISLNASEVISPHLSLSPQQLDKLVMDIVLATSGRCVIMADCFAANATADVHAIYFIRDCVYTKDIPVGDKGDGRALPVNCSICYLDDWIRCLGVELSANDAETVREFNFWRGLYDAR